VGIVAVGAFHVTIHSESVFLGTVDSKIPVHGVLAQPPELGPYIGGEVAVVAFKAYVLFIGIC
jgi:hypothetical protein